MGCGVAIDTVPDKSIVVDLGVWMIDINSSGGHRLFPPRPPSGWLVIGRLMSRQAPVEMLSAVVKLRGKS
jgi:hypothetical protein